MNHNTIIYYADVASLEDSDKYEHYYSIVSEARKKLVDNMHFDEDKRLSLGVEALLIRACQEVSIEYTQSIIIRKSQSKPYFENLPYDFNLSHSGTKALCILSNKNVGCDIERIENPNIALAYRFFTPEEQIQIESCHNTDAKCAMFYRIWTLKESFIKCLGKGFSVPFSSFSIIFDNDIPYVNQKINQNKYIFLEKRIGEYQMAACIEKNDSCDESPLISFREVLL